MNKSYNYIIAAIVSLLFTNTFAQKRQTNRWSIDVCAGGTNAVKPYSPGYWSNTVGFLHTSAGTRLMFNNKFGIKLDAGYDRIKNDEASLIVQNGNSLPFQSNYFRTSLQGVADLGRLLSFENFTDRFSVLMHLGGGMSILSSKVRPETDKMVNFMFGFTPQIKLSQRVALNFDASFIWHIYQQYTFDMYNTVNQRGFDGFIANATIGASFYLGKQKEHHDWSYSPCFPDMSYLEKENKKLDSLNKNIILKVQDDDGDGIINIADLEKDTPIGDSVDCSGVSLKNIDSDKDGVSDLIDKCKDFPGELKYDGCPKEIYDILNNVKNNTSGNITNNSSNNNSNVNNNSNNNTGNNSNNSNNNNNANNNLNNNTGNNSNNSNNNGDVVFVDRADYTSLSDVNFELNAKVLNAKYYPNLKEIVNLLKTNPNASIALEGHTDITGESSFNDKLAYKRANSIKTYLVKQGIDASRIQIVSFGENKPKYLNSTSVGRALNRRVEILIKK
jgi:outer membrane protein OmpA-like peptidoglycan-associated protein